MAPHNSNARQPHDTSEWPPAIIVDLFYASAALKAWSSNSFIQYVRERSKDAYYDEAGDQSEDNGQSGSKPYHLRSRGKISTAQPKESGSGNYHLRSKQKTSTAQQNDDLMLGLCMLRKQMSSRMGKLKVEGVCASDLARNKGIEKWLQSIE